MSKDTLLTIKGKSLILKYIKDDNYGDILKILEKIKTGHAGTAKTKDKRFVIREIVRKILDSGKNTDKEFYKTGLFFCKRSEKNAKEIGVSLIWRGYDHDPDKVKDMLLKISNDENWEVREYAGNAFADTLFYHNDFYNDLKIWSRHESENVRRAVVFSALGVRDRKNLKKGFLLLRMLMSDSSAYVRKNLGPFILGSLYGGRFPVETAEFLKKMSASKNSMVKWNIIMSFNNSYGNRHPDTAFEILKAFKDDNDRTAIRAMCSTLKFLKKHHTKKTEDFIKKNYSMNFK